MIIDSTLQTEPTTSPSSHQDKQNDDQATSPSSTCKDKLNSDVSTMKKYTYFIEAGS